MERPQESAQEPANTGRCYRHPEAETGLSCSSCGRWVCTSCIVQAPVGIRCRECGRPARMPTYDVQLAYYMRAVGVALSITIVGGILWGALILVLLGVTFVPSLIGLGVGYGSGELISLSVNRKRSVGLAWLAGGSVIGAFLVARLILSSLLGIPLGLAIMGMGSLFMVVGAILAVQRVRP